MSLRDLIAEAASGIPEAVPGHCVHERAEVASCRRCVEACPREAWLLDDAELALDTGRCDGCGLCVAHCPEGALSRPGASLEAFASRREVALGCEYAVDDGGCDGRLPCINAVPLQQVASLYRAGLRRLGLYTADCTRCARRDEHGLLDRLRVFNRVLTQRGLPRIEVSLRDTTRDPAGGGTARAGGSGVQLSRRGFLRHLGGSLAQMQRQDTDSAWHPAGRYLPPARQGDLAMNVPRIDSARCNGCDACTRVCRQRALRLSPDGAAYLVSADRCTGCRLCMDVCDQQAVTVTSLVTLEQREVALQQRRCRACGASFHRPELPGGDDDLCRICAQVNHHGRLYQVL